MLLKQARVCDPSTGIDQVMDVSVEGGRIRAVGLSLPEEETSIDCRGFVLAPSFFDPHAHFRDFGEADKETYETGAMAALRGGYTACVAMANTKPPIDRVEVLREAMGKTAGLPIDIFSSANISLGMKGEQAVDFEGLYAEGAVGFTDDGIPLTSEPLLREALRFSRKTGAVLSLHEEDPRYIVHPGYDESAPRQAEVEMIRRDLSILAEEGGHMHIQHLSSREGVEAIREAKRRMKGLTCEVTPNHLFFTKEAVSTYGTLLKVNPPLRTEDDRQALIEGLCDGTIDMIATDHAPHTKQDKALGKYESKSGILTLETAFSMACMALYHSGKMSLIRLIACMSTAPRALYGRERSIASGEIADLVLLDPDLAYTFQYSASKSVNTPLLGETLRGAVLLTMKEGRVLYNNLTGRCER